MMYHKDPFLVRQVSFKPIPEYQKIIAASFRKYVVYPKDPLLDHRISVITRKSHMYHRRTIGDHLLYPTTITVSIKEGVRERPIQSRWITCTVCYLRTKLSTTLKEWEMVYHHAPVVTLSSIQVLLEHLDFKDNANPPSDMEDPLPTFTLVKKYNTRLVLVLDMSGSMEGERIRQLRQVGFLFELYLIPIKLH